MSSSQPRTSSPEPARQATAADSSLSEPNDASPAPVIAHILFMDIVGYAKLPMETQAFAQTALQELVVKYPEVAQARTRGDVICRPTGDGIALLFSGTEIRRCGARCKSPRRSRPLP